MAKPKRRKFKTVRGYKKNLGRGKSKVQIYACRVPPGGKARGCGGGGNQKLPFERGAMYSGTTVAAIMTARKAERLAAKPTKTKRLAAKKAAARKAVAASKPKRAVSAPKSKPRLAAKRAKRAAKATNGLVENILNTTVAVLKPPAAARKPAGKASKKLASVRAQLTKCQEARHGAGSTVKTRNLARRSIKERNAARRAVKARNLARRARVARALRRSLPASAKQAARNAASGLTPAERKEAYLTAGRIRTEARIADRLAASGNERAKHDRAAHAGRKA